VVIRGGQRVMFFTGLTTALLFLRAHTLRFSWLTNHSLLLTRVAWYFFMFLMSSLW
jgi:hypothetical protein